MTGRPRIHRSHDVPRIEPQRMRELTAPTGAPHKPREARDRRGRALIRSMLAAARREIVSGTGDSPEVAAAALRAWRAGRAELGPMGASALAALWAWAVQSATAQVLAFEAARAGLASDRGLQLAGEAQRAQGRAERSWTAAVAAAGLLGGRAPEPDLAALIEAGRAPRTATVPTATAEEEDEQP